MADSPAVSVIIACRNARDTIQRCLDALARQKTAIPFEVIVADSSGDGTDRLIAENYPAVRLLHFEGRKWPGDARNAALQVARGELIGFIDADCVASETWIETLAGALANWSGSAGGVIAQAEPASTSAWAAYLCEFTHWMPGTPEGIVFEVPTCNMGVPRHVLAEAGPFLEGVYCSDSEFHWRLKSMGRKTRFVPEMNVAHITEGGWTMLARHEFFHGRSFGRMRVLRGGYQGPKLWIARVSGVLLPLWLVVKTAGRIVGRRRYVGKLVRCLPLFAVACGAWGMGELAGYWSGDSE